MAGPSFEHARDARDALLAVVSDPAYGAGALSDARAMSNLLKDLLPDAPRETGLLIAAAEAGVARALLEHTSQGMDATTAVSLAASALNSSTAFTPEACFWAASELAIALGLTTAQSLPQGAAWPPGRVTGALAAAPAELRQERRTQRPGQAWQQGPATTSRQNVADRAGGPGGYGRKRRLRVLVIAGLAAAAIAVVVIVVNRLQPASGPALPPAAATGSSAARQPTSKPLPSPRSVVEAYLTAVNRHDWPRVWQLGGKNLGESYQAMVAGYRRTRTDVITSIKARAGTVAVRILAYETNGQVQSYALSYVVGRGVIIAGTSTLLGTR